MLPKLKPYPFILLMSGIKYWFIISQKTPKEKMKFLKRLIDIVMRPLRGKEKTGRLIRGLYGSDGKNKNNKQRKKKKNLKIGGLIMLINSITLLAPSILASSPQEDNKLEKIIHEAIKRANAYNLDEFQTINFLEQTIDENRLDIKQSARLIAHVTKARGFGAGQTGLILSTLHKNERTKEGVKKLVRYPEKQMQELAAKVIKIRGFDEKQVAELIEGFFAYKQSKEELIRFTAEIIHFQKLNVQEIGNVLRKLSSDLEHNQHLGIS